MYRGLSKEATVAKLLLHIHSYLLDTDANIVDISVIDRSSTYHQRIVALRRQLDALLGASTSKRPVQVPPEKEPDLADMIIDANNRFSVLFTGEGRENDHTYYLNDEDEVGLTTELTLEERRYVTQAQSNATRKKMGYPPKGVASLDSPEYSQIQQRVETTESLRVIVNRVYRPLFRWRSEFLIPFKEGKLSREELTIVPLTLLGVYEQCFRAFDRPGCRLATLDPGIDGVPRVWDDLPKRKVPPVLRNEVRLLATQEG
jgi:hypothetical protein